MKKKQLRKVMRHAYLKEIHGGELPLPCTDESYPKFDIRDTYSLNDTMLDWLYERLRFFQDEVSQYVDLDYEDRKIIIDGEVFTQRQCIDRMVDDIKEFYKASNDALNEYSELNAARNAGTLSNEEFNNKFVTSCEAEDRRQDSAKDDLFKVLSKCFWAMWW